MAFPTTLDDLTTNNDITDGTSVVQASDIDTLNVAVDAIQTKVGIDGSAVTTSLDYLVKKQGIKQIVNVQDGNVATGTTAMPFDNSIPQNTEGDQYMTLAITPTSATNKLLIEVVVFITCAGADHISAALFQDSTAGALASGAEYAANGAMTKISFSHYMTSGTTSSTTFKVRAGNTDATQCTFNGVGGARRHGGVMASSITIYEIKE